MDRLVPTIVYDSYWRFAAERLAMYLRRLSDPYGPWTDDPILQCYRFTNSFRAADRVSQYLMSEVQYRSDRSQAPAEIFFRTLLFKIFNRIDTWQLLESELGPLSWQSLDIEAVSEILEKSMRRGHPIYSAAYIMASPKMGRTRKHENHLLLLSKMMDNGLPGRIEQSSCLQDVYELLKPWPGLGPFLAFQYAIDLNYSNLVGFDESSFVVAGPGAIDGISKCFQSTCGMSAEDIIYHMVDIQDAEFARLGLSFPGLFGRRLQPIDCQNLFCEIGKYARVAHPEFAGASGRTRIKQGYSGGQALHQPFFPPRWGLKVPIISNSENLPVQGQLF
jgi:alpha-glutamyl/putrescinyl thymine pyrophosphorylase clade 1